MLLSLTVRCPQVPQSAAGSSLHWLMKRKQKEEYKEMCHCVYRKAAPFVNLCNQWEISIAGQMGGRWKLYPVASQRKWTERKHDAAVWREHTTRRLVWPSRQDGVWHLRCSFSNFPWYLTVFFLPWCFLWASQHKWAQKSIPYNKIQTLYYFLLSSSAAMKRLTLGVMTTQACTQCTHICMPRW